MKINIKETLKDYRGKDLKIRDEKNKLVAITVRDALNLIINGAELNANGQAMPLTAEAKGRIYQLSIKLWGAKEEMKLSVESAAFIKERAGKVANISPLIYGRVCDLLENKS